MGQEDVGMERLKAFLSVTNPPFVGKTRLEVCVALTDLMVASSLAIQGYPSMLFNLTEFLIRYRLTDIPAEAPERAEANALLVEYENTALTDAQRCDRAVTFWALTGEDKHVQVVVDFADGFTPTQQKYRGAAEWCMQSLRAQSPLWRAAVDRIRALRRGEGN